MGRGVKAGTRRGHYKRHGKPRLKQLARGIRCNRIDAEAVAQAFEASGGTFNLAIAAQLRAGLPFNAERLASALEKLAIRLKPCPPRKRLPLSMAKGALRHLDRIYGGKGLPIHKALGVVYPYADDPRVRAYHRQLTRDYGPRSLKHTEKRLNEVWPGRRRGYFPHLEQAVKEAILGHGVPLAVWRAVRRKY